MKLSDVAQYTEQGFFKSTITVVGVSAFEGDETRHMSRIANTYQKKTKAYTGKLKLKEKLGR